MCHCTGPKKLNFPPFFKIDLIHLKYVCTSYFLYLPDNTEAPK